jgi:hypothetical protein
VFSSFEVKEEEEEKFKEILGKLFSGLSKVDDVILRYDGNHFFVN